MYSKEDQLNHERIKPKATSTFWNRKPMKKKRITTDDELTYNNWLHEEAQMQKYKCMVCGEPVQHYHHVKEYSTDKKRQNVQIPLCNEHHLGTELPPHGTPKLFRQTYSMEQQDKVAHMLHLRYLTRGT
jgi:DNA-directed RNA polymerase subunit RPC12/RpoP